MNILRKSWAPAALIAGSQILSGCLGNGIEIDVRPTSSGANPYNGVPIPNTQAALEACNATGVTRAVTVNGQYHCKPIF